MGFIYHTFISKLCAVATKINITCAFSAFVVCGQFREKANHNIYFVHDHWENYETFTNGVLSHILVINSVIEFCHIVNSTILQKHILLSSLCNEIKFMLLP